MADRIEPFTVTVPAGTAIAAPQITTLAFDDGVVTRLIITIPPGPSGLLGFAFLHKGGQVIPFTGANWIIGDDRIVDWDLSGMPTASGWQLKAYNTDIFVHSLYIEFLIDEIPAPLPATIPLVAIG
jgi:cellulose synthase/poly-beta-1,6-N-acetylglucosamine synthase-like glycosyltransferase